MLSTVIMLLLRTQLVYKAKDLQSEALIGMASGQRHRYACCIRLPMPALTPATGPHLQRRQLAVGCIHGVNGGLLPLQQQVKFALQHLLPRMDVSTPSCTRNRQGGVQVVC